MKDKKPYVPPRTMEMPAPPKVAQQVTPEQVRREAQREALKVMPGEIGIAQNLILQKGESAREEFTQADARKERVFDCVKSAVDCIQDSPDLAKAKTKFFQGQKGQLGTGEVEAAEQIFDQVYVNMQEMQYEGSAARPAPIATQTEAAGKQSADTTPQPHLNPEKAPAALDVARIDSRWVQFPGQVDPTNPKTPVVYLDTGESEIVDLSRYEGRRFHFGRGADGPGVSPFDESSAGSPNKPRVGHMDGQITEAEVAAIHFGEQDGAYPELKREVDVWGEFTRKRDNVQGGGPAPAAGKTSAADLADDLVAAPLYSTSIPSDKQLRDAGLSDESIEKLKERVQAIREDPQAMALARNALLSENTFERNEARLMYMTYLGIKPATQLRVLPYAGDVTQYQGPEDPKTVPLADLIAANKAAKDRLRVAEGITEQLQPYPNVHAFGEKLAELNPDVVHNGEVGYIVNENPLQEFDPRKMEHGLKKVPMPETIEEGFLRCWSMPSQSVTGYQRALYLGYGVEAGRRFLRRSVDKESRRRVIDDKLGEGTADQLGQFQTHIIADIYEEPRQRPEYKYYKPEMIEPLDPGEPHFRALCNASQYGFEALDPEVGCRAFEDGQARESFNKDLEQAFWSVNPHRIDQHVEATPETRRRVTQQMIGDFGLEGVRTELIDVRNPSLAEEREFVDSLNTAIMKKYG